MRGEFGMQIERMNVSSSATRAGASIIAFVLLVFFRSDANTTARCRPSPKNSGVSGKESNALRLKF